MEFLNKYKYKKLQDGCVMLDITVVENYPDIALYVNPNSDIVAIFDGGSTLATLGMVYDFSQKNVVDDFVRICRTYKLSKNGNVLYLECTKQEFDKRLTDFVCALNKICNI